MNLVNPATLYGSGLATFDAKPYIQAAERAAARKAAKDEALDKYYQNLPNTINEQGVRDAEIPLLHNIKDGIQSYWIKNKEAIKKGNTPEAFNYGKMFRDAQGIVQQSKNRTKTSAEVAKLRGNPKYDYVFDDPQLMEKIANHDAPLGDKNSKAIDFNELVIPPPPLDVDKFAKGVNVVAKPDPNATTYQPIDGDKFNRLEITPKKLSEADLNNIHIYANAQLENNRSLKQYIKEKVKNNPEMAAKLGEIFEKAYKHPIQTDQDVAAALTLSMIDTTPTQKTVPNKETITTAANDEWANRNKQKEEFATNMQEDRQNFAREMQRDRQYFQSKYKGATTEELTKKVEGYVDGQFDDAVNKPSEAPGKFSWWKSDDPIYAIKNDQQELNAFQRKGSKTGKIYTASKLFYRPKTNEVIVKGIREDGGDLIISKPTYVSALVNSKMGTKEKINQLLTNETITTKKTTTNSGSTTEIKTIPTHSKKSLLDNGWTKDQIEKASKAGKIKVTD